MKYKKNHEIMNIAVCENIIRMIKNLPNALFYHKLHANGFCEDL